MAKQEYAKVKIVLPKNSKAYKYGTRISVNGKPLMVSNYALTSIGSDTRTELVLHIPADGFEMEIEDVQFE